MSRSLCKAHLKKYLELQINMKATWRRTDPPRKCKYPDCNNPARYEVEIIQEVIPA